MKKSYAPVINTLVVLFGGLLVPLITFGAGVTTWGLALTALVLFTIVIAAMNLEWEQKWFLLSATVLAILGSTTNWRLLPLALAQVGLAFLTTTQDMQPPFKASCMIAQAAFLQVLLTMAGSQVLTRGFLLRLVFTALPFIIASWSAKMPVWLTAILVVGVTAAGYFTQTLTLIAALLTIIWALLPIRITERMPSWYWAAGFPVIATILYLTLIHG